MEKEAAEKFAKSIVKGYEQELVRVLMKNPIQVVEDLQKKLSKHKKSDLQLIIQDLLVDLKALDKRKQEFKDVIVPGEEISYYELHNILFENTLWRNVSSFQTSFIEYFITYNLLQTYLVSSEVISSKYQKELLKKFNVTPKKLKDLILGFLENKAFLARIKQGGSEKSLDEKQRLEFLALYNRYFIVIKNARKEYRRLKRQKKSEIKAKLEALEKYEIPQELLLSAFSSDSPGEVALDWAKDSLKTELSRDYLKNLLNKIRKEHKRWGFIIHVDFRVGRRIYALNIANKSKAELLRYTPIDESVENKTDMSEGFLVSMSI